MTVRIDLQRCNGCGKQQESCCEEICPGDLFYRVSGKAVLREAGDCWDCFSCVKACPREALSVELPFQISEAQNRLTARIQKQSITWKLLNKNGHTVAHYTIQNRKKTNNTE